MFSNINGEAWSGVSRKGTIGVKETTYLALFKWNYWKG